MQPYTTHTASHRAARSFGGGGGCESRNPGLLELAHHHTRSHSAVAQAVLPQPRYTYCAAVCSTTVPFPHDIMTNQHANECARLGDMGARKCRCDGCFRFCLPISGVLVSDKKTFFIVLCTRRAVFHRAPPNLCAATKVY